MSGREGWLLAGQELLRRGGIAAVDLAALAGETGLTTGSFYHHFENVEAFRDELARFFGAAQVETSLADLDDIDPRIRLENLARRSRDHDMVALYGAMRTWAATSAAADDAVRAADHRMLGFLATAFRDLGHDSDDARLRAVLLMSVGVARLHAPWPLARRFNDHVLELLTGRDAPAPPA